MIKLNIQMFGGRGASSNKRTSIDINKMSVKELSNIVWEKKGTNWLLLSDGAKISFSPTGMALSKGNKYIATNKKDIVSYIKKNKLKVYI